eukprot:m.74665 g.74665  ORF g.74665 m.74665 type:complete len:329 (+) comp11816_c0_seq2:160-1146(+)
MKVSLFVLSVVCAVAVVGVQSEGISVILVREDNSVSTLQNEPQDPTFETSARFNFQADSFRQDLPLECSLDSGTYTSCTSPLTIQGPLSDGVHVFRVRVAGNSPTIHTWTIDTVVPVVSFVSTPSIVIDVGDAASFQIASSEPSLFLCLVDDATDFSLCPGASEDGNDTSIVTLFPSTPKGAHRLEVKVVDLAGSHSESIVYDLSADACVETPFACKGNNVTTTAGTCGAGYYLDVQDRNICRACYPIASCSPSQLHCTHYSKYNSVCGECSSSFSFNSNDKIVSTVIEIMHCLCERKRTDVRLCACFAQLKENDVSCNPANVFPSFP